MSKKKRCMSLLLMTKKFLPIILMKKILENFNEEN